MIDYKLASLDELALHFTSCTRQAIFQQISYYTKNGNSAMVQKIKFAKLLAKRIVLDRLLEGMA